MIQAPWIASSSSELFLPAYTRMVNGILIVWARKDVELPWDPIKGWKLRIQHCPADGIHENGQPAVRMYYYCEIPLERAASFGEALSVASQICTGDDHVYVVDGPMKNADGPGPVLYMQPGDSITIM